MESVQGQPDASQAEQGDQDPEDEEQIVGRLFGESAGKGDAALAERGTQLTIPLAKEVRQLSMKQRNCQTDQDSREL